MGTYDLSIAKHVALAHKGIFDFENEVHAHVDQLLWSLK
jgi:hypothetical protein